MATGGLFFAQHAGPGGRTRTTRASSGREDDARQGWSSRRRELADDIEAIHIWHANIEEEQIWFGSAHQIDRLCCGGAFANDLSIRGDNHAADKWIRADQSYALRGKR